MTADCHAQYVVHVDVHVRSLRGHANKMEEEREGRREEGRKEGRREGRKRQEAMTCGLLSEVLPVVFTIGEVPLICKSHHTLIP